MTSQYRHRRSSNPAVTFSALEPGEVAVNTSTRQLTVGDAASGTVGAPVLLLAIRLFDTRAIYSINDYVLATDGLYRAKINNGPGVFNPSNWDAIAGQQIGPFVQRAGDIMAGHLGLPSGPGLDQAVRRDYVDALIAPLASTVYVDQQDALAVLKAGSVMTGPLTLSGAPTAANHAVTKLYADGVGSPPGTIIDFGGPTTPSGWLPCDGTEISRATYSALFAAIGTAWGSGNGSTTFNIPQLQSRYRRHRDTGNYSGTTVGLLQTYQNASHTHGVSITSQGISVGHTHTFSGTTGAADRSLSHSHTGVPSPTSITSGSFVTAAGYNYISGSKSTDAASTPDHLHGYSGTTSGENTGHTHLISGATGASGGNETRPWSATVLTCIKY